MKRRGRSTREPHPNPLSVVHPGNLKAIMATLIKQQRDPNLHPDFRNITHVMLIGMAFGFGLQNFPVKLSGSIYRARLLTKGLSLMAEYVPEDLKEQWREIAAKIIKGGEVSDNRVTDTNPQPPEEPDHGSAPAD